MKKKEVYRTKRGSQRARQALASTQKSGYKLDIQVSPAKILPKEKEDYSLSTQEKEDLKALKKREEPQDVLDRLNAEVRTFKPVEIKAAPKSPARENGGRSPSKTRKLLADAMANSPPPKKSTTYKLHQTPITSFTTVRDPYWRTSWYSPYRSIFSKPSGKQEGYCF